MNDTVTKILALADDYADVSVGYEECRATQDDLDAARQALQDELTRLFTPLSDAAIYAIERDAWSKYAGTPVAVNTTLSSVVARMIETAHGITGETK
mgnify:CR=1 FL=1